MMQGENIFYVEANNKKYAIKSVQTGNYFRESRFDFWLLTEDKEMQLKTNADNELVRELCAIIGVDPVIELVNIMHKEIKEELETSFRLGINVD